MIPSTWTQVNPEVMAHARNTALGCLRDARTPERLAEYYDVTRTYAGASFLRDADQHADDITPADLHAVSLLAVPVLQPASRRLLDDGEHRDKVLHALRDLPREAALADADAAMFKKMAAFHEATKTALGKSPWVTASKLTARKRPRLIPGA